MIQTLDDEDADLGPSLIGGEEAKKESKSSSHLHAQSRIPLPARSADNLHLSQNTRADTLPAVPVPQGPIKFGRSKPAKSSSLRKSINFNDDESVEQSGASASDGLEEQHRPGTSAVVRPAISRSSSLKKKKRASTSRLSFGPGDLVGDGDGAENEPISTPKKTLGKRVIENNALRRSGSGATLPTRLAIFDNDDEEQPKYSKEYLQELQSSTPNTPQNLSSLRITDDADDGYGAGLSNDDAMDLDPSELDGALIVPSQDLARRSPSTQALTRVNDSAHILTEAEIRVRKERRARLALEPKEGDFISLDDDSDKSETEFEKSLHSNRVTVRFDSNKPRRSESRLIAEDEDLGEGYDEFVGDGDLALGRKAEREATLRHRKEMAELIQAAEAGSDAESDDSEAERRAAYEAAQRRAGMDGLHRRGDDDDGELDLDGGGGVNMIPRMKPLPDLDDVLQRMRNLVQGLEDEVNRRRSKIADLEKEKGEILAREVEVQEILNQAGQKYQAVVGTPGGPPTGPGTPGAVPGTGSISGFGEAIKFAVSTHSPLRVPPVLPPGIAVGGGAGELPVERGLESFGTTPTTRPDPDQDEEMS